MKIYIFFLFLFNFTVFASVDIILESFQNFKVAEKKLQELNSFVKYKNLDVNVKIKEMNNLYYLKIGTFSDSIRNDEEFLALFAIQYPNLIIVKSADSISGKQSDGNYGINNENIGFWNKYESLIQWIIMIIMAIWGAVIIYLRVKMMRKVLKSNHY